MQFIQGQGLDAVLARAEAAPRPRPGRRRTPTRGRPGAGRRHRPGAARPAGSRTGDGREPDGDRGEPGAAPRTRPQPDRRPAAARLDRARRSLRASATSRRRTTTAAWPGSACRWPRRWPTPTSRASCTATSSRRTCCWTPQGTVWVTDFGLAKAEGTDDLTAHRRHRRHAALHGPGAVPGPVRPAQRRLRPGPDALRAADAAAGLRRRRPGPADRAGPARGAAAGRASSTRTIPRDLETIVLKAIAKEPAAALPDGRGAGRGPAAVPGRPADPGAAEPRRRSGLAVVPAQPGRGRVARGRDHAAGDDRGGGLDLGRAAGGEPPAGRSAERERPGEPLGLVPGPGPGRALQRPARPAVRRPRDPGPGRPPGRLPGCGGELRDEAIACLALADLRPVRTLAGRSLDEYRVAFDATFDRYAVSDAEGNVSLRRVADDVEVARLPRVGPCPASRGSSCASPPTGAGWPSATTSTSRRAGPRLGPAPGRAGPHPDPGGRLAVRLQPGRAPAGRGPVRRHDRPARRGLGPRAGAVRDRVPASSSAFPVRVPPRRPAGRGQQPDEPARSTSWTSSPGRWSPGSSTRRRRTSSPGAATAGGWRSAATTTASTCGTRPIRGRPLARLVGHEDKGLSVAFSRGGDVLVSTAWDDTTRLWDPERGRPLLRGAGQFPGPQRRRRSRGPAAEQPARSLGAGPGAGVSAR